MTVKELYNASPWSHIFIVRRDETSKEHLGYYGGGKQYADKKVMRVYATSYPMYKSVLEVEID